MRLSPLSIFHGILRAKSLGVVRETLSHGGQPLFGPCLLFSFPDVGTAARKVDRPCHSLSAARAMARVTAL